MRSVDDQVRQASAEASVQSTETIENLRIEVERLEQEFGNLMARINRDGGHKAAEFKTTREAGEHCEQVVLDLIAKVERLELEAVTLRLSAHSIHRRGMQAAAKVATPLRGHHGEYIAMQILAAAAKGQA